MDRDTLSRPGPNEASSRRSKEARRLAAAASDRAQTDFLEEIVSTAARIGAAKSRAGAPIVRTDAVWRLICALERSHYCNAISDAARLLRITRQSAHELARQAERLRLVELAPNPDDRRIVQLLLTPSARSQLAAARSAERLWLAELLLGLERRDMQTATHVLRVIRQRLLRNDNAAKQKR